MTVPAHSQKETHHYIVHFPEHGPREGDPHYVDFEHYRRTHVGTAHCLLEVTGECKGGLELHHAHIEFALTNGVDFAALERDYPGISDPAQVGAWVESEPNFAWYCAYHHRGHAGVHTAAASDFEAQKYVRGLIS